MAIVGGDENRQPKAIMFSLKVNESINFHKIAELYC
jgi:hypothetical protein